ncbi:hypothetical protein Rhopal_004699-T1 [Rhodotorula paludigena]|uniref:Proteophosphoglycan ppg4 n=1 Tax=Rhodotorula paludigena TaxID=86838 RepID=A0AAV5GQ69_9BASI|nr:hypothetical protein Rhopal_004699-T1 [Rhodotorula paludigena]
MSYPAPPPTWSGPGSNHLYQPVASTSAYSDYGPSPNDYTYPQHAEPSPAAYQQHQPTALSPPPSFGVRRVRSAMGFNTQPPPAPLNPSSLYASSPYPPSPVSPSYPSGAVHPAPAHTDYLTGSPAMRKPAYMHDQYNYAPTQTQTPRTPPPSARRRVASAQPAFPVAPQGQRPATSASAYEGYSGGLGVELEAQPMAYSHTMPGNAAEQAASAEEVSRFFLDMNEILGPEAMAALSPTSTYHPPLPAVSVQPPPLPQQQNRATYNVSGVLLDEDEYRAFADSPSVGHQPSPVEGQPFLLPDPTYGQPAPQANGYLAPAQFAYELQRPASAPPTPSFESDAMFQFAPYGSTYESAQPARSVSLNRRRGSSLDPAMIPRQYSSGLAGSYAPPSQHASYDAYEAPALLERAYAPPPQSQYPPSFRVAPPPQEPASYQAVTTPPRRAPPPVAPPTPMSTSSSASATGPAPPTPTPTAKRASVGARRGGRRGKGGGGDAISFINFSAADSKEILGGVAPSGTSKKRAREDEGGEAREGKKVAG